VPRIVDRQEVREELMTKSYELFARKGFGAVTMRDLARELGVSTGTLYHYFPNKSELFHETLRFLVARDIERVLGQIDADATPEQRVRVTLDYVTRHEPHFRGRLSLLFEACRGAGGEDGSVRAFGELMRVYREAFSDNLGVADPRIGRMALGLVIGDLVQRMVDPQGSALDELAKFITELLGDRAAQEV